MNKADLIAAVAGKARITNVKAEQLVNAILVVMKEALISGERIELRGFGAFAVKHYNSYLGHNPKTGEAIEVKPKRSPVFKTSKELRERLLRS